MISPDHLRKMCMCQTLTVRAKVQPSKAYYKRGSMNALYVHLKVHQSGGPKIISIDKHYVAEKHFVRLIEKTTKLFMLMKILFQLFPSWPD